MNIHSKTKDYSVEIYEDLGFLPELIGLPNCFYVIDSNVLNLYRDVLSGIPLERLYILNAIEDKKTIETCLDICNRIVEFPEKRNLTLVSIGGGITQDITGFVSNIIYRGIKWIFVPTTLLASCDSCIGGKTSLNYKQYKNLLGTFYPPNKIYTSPVFFDTLKKQDFYSGLGEIYKFAIMQGKIEQLLNDQSCLMANDHKTICSYLFSSLEYKKSIIEEDEFDSGKRITLNFGHTFGHALESISNYEIPHGTGVAIGMLIASEISFLRGILSEELLCKIYEVILPIIDLTKGVYIQSNSSFFASIKKDKKQTSEGFSALLCDNDFNVNLFKNIEYEEIVSAVSSTKQKLK